jgi:hypothetical protein
MSEQKREKAIVIIVWCDGQIEIRVLKVTITWRRLFWGVLVAVSVFGGVGLPDAIEWGKSVLELLG